MSRTITQHNECLSGFRLLKLPVDYYKWITTTEILLHPQVTLKYELYGFFLLMLWLIVIINEQRLSNN